MVRPLTWSVQRLKNPTQVGKVAMRRKEMACSLRRSFAFVIAASCAVVLVTFVRHDANKLRAYNEEWKDDRDAEYVAENETIYGDYGHGRI